MKKVLVSEAPRWVDQEIRNLLLLENSRLRIFDFVEQDHLKSFLLKLFPEYAGMIFDLVHDFKTLLIVLDIPVSKVVFEYSNALNLFFRNKILDVLKDGSRDQIIFFVDKVIKEVSSQVITLSNDKSNTESQKSFAELKIKKKDYEKEKIKSFIWKILKIEEVFRLVEIKTESSKFRKENEIPEISDLKSNKNMDSKALSQQLNHTDFDSCYVENAGLVLVWPYLQIFFKELGLLDQNLAFKSENQQRKAIHLLQYLSYGEEAIEELEFLLNKLLCGMSFDGFVSSQLELTATEKEECDHLLSSLIQNWPVLKNTSAQGLRQTFLQRQGVLTKNHKGWLLQIERKAYDIVLDRLTWPIALIKLPWNDYLIHVKW